MVEFSKVVETELNLALKKKKLINKDLTLGQLKFNLEKVKQYKEFLPFLEEVITHRNGSAHTGVSTRKKVKKVRALLLEDKWLERILEIG